jgi:hypothetical protein
VKTIAQQLARGYVVAVVATLLLAVVATAALVAATSAKDRVINRDAQLVIDSTALEREVLSYAGALNRYLLTSDDAFVPTAQQQSLIQDRLALLEGAVHTNGGRALLEQARTDTAAYLDAARQIVQLRAEATNAEVEAAATQQLYPARDALTATLGEFSEREQRLIEEAVEAANRRVWFSLVVIWLLAVVAAAVTLIVNLMVGRRVSRQLAAMSGSVEAAANDVLAGTSQQVIGGTEQASAVQETVATVDDLAQSAEETARRARRVAEGAHAAAASAETGRAALDDATAAMMALQSRVEGIATSTLALAERAQSISEIIGTVDDIAEQTNLLALNAAIEAARAGEHGRGFAVVATEVRSLAEDSRTATAKVGGILHEIQQATNAAVMATEEGIKSVGEGVQLVAGAGATIRDLAEAVAAATAASEQIAAASGQQAGATAQISQAMRDVSAVMEQTMAAARQAEQTARGLTGIAQDLNDLVSADR